IKTALSDPVSDPAGGGGNSTVGGFLASMSGAPDSLVTATSVKSVYPMPDGAAVAEFNCGLLCWLGLDGTNSTEVLGNLTEGLQGRQGDTGGAA
ncbi:unnamed protein product, partial [Amoebophrya sp. A25]